MSRRTSLATRTMFRPQHRVSSIASGGERRERGKPGWDRAGEGYRVPSSCALCHREAGIRRRRPSGSGRGRDHGALKTCSGQAMCETLHTHAHLICPHFMDLKAESQRCEMLRPRAPPCYVAEQGRRSFDSKARGSIHRWATGKVRCLDSKEKRGPFQKGGSTSALKYLQTSHRKETCFILRLQRPEIGQAVDVIKTDSGLRKNF